MLAITFAVMASIIMNVLDTTIVNVALPHMQGGLRANVDQATWILTSYMLAMVIVTPMTGLLVERFGQRSLMLGSVTGFIICSALAGQSHSIVEMVVWRFMQGALGASMVPVGQAILVSSYPPERRGVAMATLGMGIMLGPILGPILGGYITDDMSWRWCFYVNVPVGLVALALLIRHVPDGGKSAQPRPIDWLGFVSMATGLGALQAMLSLGNEDNWFSSRTIVTLTVLAVAFLLLFVLRSLDRPNPVVNLRLLRNEALALGSIGIGLFGLALYGVMVILPIFLQEHMGYEAQTSGLVMAPQGMGAMVSMWLAGRLLNRHANPRVLALTGITLGAIGSWLTLSYNLSVSPAWIIWPGVIRGLGLGLISIPIFTIAFSTLTRQETAEGSGLFNLMRNLGGSVGIAIISTIITEYTQVGWNQIGGHITPYEFATPLFLHAARLPLDPRTWAIVGDVLGQQAAMRGILDALVFVFWSFLGMIPIILFMPAPKRSVSPQPEAMLAE
ncbi:MAG: DHA2 family efflux MFS transporter permease subunit [Gammaproteobacteria bacterium]|nr:DHA2 family efflux MFS transporter permease subunit [Gammaproteobacteria bacterium]